MSKYSFKTSEFKESLVRLFKDKDLNNCHIHMDGRQMMNKFLRECWSYALDKNLLKVINIEQEQDSFLKGYLTEEGKKFLKI